MGREICFVISNKPETKPIALLFDIVNGLASLAEKCDFSHKGLVYLGCCGL